MTNSIQTCALTGSQFAVTDWEKQILSKLGMPLPTLCSDERLRRRLAHRNERTLYKSKCAMTGAVIVSLYPPDSPLKVYSQEAWWGDSWDAREFGRDFDFGRPFFDQFHELRLETPRAALINMKADNSEYCNVTTSNKNCYLVFGGDFNQDSFYCTFNFRCRNVCDCYWVDSCELTYESVDCFNCYNIKYSQNSHNCSDSSFLYECRGCKNCFGCIGLRNKTYHLFNKPYSAEEYGNKIKELNLDTRSGIDRMKKFFTEIKLKYPHKYAEIVNCENSIGDRLVNSKNCENCFDVISGQDLKDVFIALNIKDSLSCDHTGHGNTELFYEMLGSVDGYNCALCSYSWYSQNTFYCDFVANSRDLFGCTNMKRSQYCILNKQYTREEYEKLVPKIIEHMKSTGEWGEFFPISNSLFTYNETIAQEYFPLTKEEALKKGYKWKEKDTAGSPQKQEIPDSIKEVSDDIIKSILACDECGKNYKIIPEELKFYRMISAPAPSKCPECRHKHRLALRNPLKLFDRVCAKCSAPIKTSYSPDRPEIVYCEKCYLNETYA